jgi:WD40 repeat protein
MSTGLSRQRSNSKSSSVRSVRSDINQKPPTPSITPGSDEFAFEPCAATGSFLLYAQRNVILCLHHDTLAVERRFTRHREDVAWISADTVSERGAGRLVVSYDAGSTAIVWDLVTGDEVARFASYDQIRVATWMRNGNVAFGEFSDSWVVPADLNKATGNAQGNIILFEPSTSEHISARTIFDPITALAPAADCRTFAIG